MGRKNPAQELRDFLDRYPLWLQQALRWDFPATPEDASAFAQLGLDRFLDLLERYEALARRVPEEWRGYRKRRKEIALATLPTGTVGRPRKDSFADEAFELQSRGMSHPQIATEMKRRYPEATSNPDSIRKLIASRKPHSNPEKI